MLASGQARPFGGAARAGPQKHPRAEHRCCGWSCHAWGTGRWQAWRVSGGRGAAELLSAFVGLFFFFFARLILKTHVEELKECLDQKSPMTTTKSI